MSMVTAKTRANQVRSRRNKRGRKKPVLTKSRSRKIAMRTATPTVVRSRSMAKAPGSRVNRKQARKRNYLPLKTLGAEIRLPAVPAVRAGWRLLSGALTLAIGFAIYTLLTSSNLRVGVVEVAGVERISAQDVNLVLGVFGASIFSVEPDVLRDKLNAAYPEMIDISVKAGFPGRVSVEASERLPILAWEQGDISVWVDENGVAFRKRGEIEGLVQIQAMQAPPLQATETEIPDQIITSEMVQAILKLSEQAPAGTTILYDPDHGLGWQDPQQGWQVYFGPIAENMEERLAIYQAMIEMFNERRIKPALISLEHLHAPYYRLVLEE